MKKTSKPANYKPFGLLFAAALFVLALLHLVLPKQDFSPTERRYLAKPPAFSLESGTFSQNVESYVNDHFPLRKAFLRVDAARRQLSGQGIFDPVWRLSGGQLAEAPVQLAASRFENNLKRLEGFAQAAGLPAVLLVPPSAGAVSNQTGYYAYPDAQALAQIREAAPSLRLVPLLEGFSGEGNSLYYSTDPHWNAQGAFRAYQAAGPVLGFEPLPAAQFQKTDSPGFYGTNYARSALWERKPDVLSLWDAGLALSLRFDKQEESHDSLFFTIHLKGADQYPVFLDGNHGLTQINNQDKKQGPRLLIIKDSFANSLVPLLLPHYQAITLIDLRAWRGQPGEILKLDQFDSILYVYSLASLAQDSNFPWLR